MRYLIGIADTCAEGIASVGLNYTNAVLRAGHLPVLLPYCEDPEMIRETLSHVDSLLLAGGGADVNPARYGMTRSERTVEVNGRRDDFEYTLLNLATELRLPVLGICRGIQVINACFGGTLYQDLPTEIPESEINHQRPDKEWEGVHDIVIDPDSQLHARLQATRVRVNSTHHQSVRLVAPGFRVSARSDDGVIEAIESLSLPIAAVQFHPERLAWGEDRVFTRLFATLPEWGM